MLVEFKATSDPNVVALSRKVRGLKMFQREFNQRWLSWRYPNRSTGLFSLGSWPDGTQRAIMALSPDLLHLHWVGNSLCNLDMLHQIRRPVVWTIHDMMPFTGGCHYDSGCGKYRVGCGQCPELSSSGLRDASSREWRCKANAIESNPLVVVSPSQWLAACARQSLMFRDRDVRVIPYGVNTSLFKPRSKAQCREILGLPIGKPLILFAAQGGTGDPRKGFIGLGVSLEKSIDNWEDRRPDLAILGQSGMESSLPNGYCAHLLGTFHDEITLALAYSAADIFVAPSMQDNLPNTIMEALACGTPVVSFCIGGIPDMVEHKQNGYLAEAGNFEELIRGIRFALADPQRLRVWRAHARNKVLREFDDSLQATRYEALYTELTHHSGNQR
jgi:glycosyltransferase involved in cell wall biosynthesis